ncbi:MAG: peptide deformylase [Oscillospiraceae bacterium]|jgi:peptide deformylase|nr:peptide deformylase [Oscillospiraceae bacterium]
MALRNILKDGDAALLKKSRDVTDFNARLHKLLDDMRETLIDANGLGLAAPQVGVLRRAALVVDTSVETEDIEEQIIELINPEIIASSGEQEGAEGCLSVPGVYGLVKRPRLVKVRARDRHGREFEAWGEGLTARAFCHEIDHLNGIMFSEYVSRYLTDEEIEEMRRERDEDGA